MAAIITLIVIALGAYLVFFVFFPLARGAIYDPSSPVETRIMVEMATVVRGRASGGPRFRGWKGRHRAC